MATKGYSASNPIGGIKVITWSNLSAGDDGKPIRGPQFADRSVHVTGTFGVGGSVEIQGSNLDPATGYTLLSDPLGNSLSITLTKIKQVLENTFYLRPVVTGGDGTTSLTISLLLSTPTEYGLQIDSDLP